MKEKPLGQKINGWLSRDPNELKAGIKNPLLRSMSTVSNRKLRIGFVFLGLFFWGFACFLLTFTQLKPGSDDVAVAVNGYWIEIVVFFV